MHNAILASSSAKFWPMQTRGPQPNGRNAPGSLDALEIPSENLFGLNSCASLPQISGSWWIKSTGSSTITPAGYVTPPITISLYVLLENAMAGGYNRRTS
uniref:Uncharacterized protein n=1 Tax=Arundo donax TaxID=35708 RepID=A0A0A8Y8G8_ARUDO